MSNKLCHFCFIEKSLENFYVWGDNRYHKYCKQCVLLRAKLKLGGDDERLAEFKARKAEHTRKYRESHKEQISAYYKQWYRKTNRYRPRKDKITVNGDNIVKSSNVNYKLKTVI